MKAPFLKTQTKWFVHVKAETKGVNGNGCEDLNASQIMFVFRTYSMGRN